MSSQSLRRLAAVVAVVCAAMPFMHACGNDSDNPMIPPTPQAPPQEWSWQNPQPQGNGLRSVGVLTSTSIVGVGDVGTIVRSGDGGATWSVVESGTSEVLFGVDFVTPTTGSAVGTSGTLLRTEDGGATWAAQMSGTTGLLTAISVIDLSSRDPR